MRGLEHLARVERMEVRVVVAEPLRGLKKNGCHAVEVDRPRRRVGQVRERRAECRERLRSSGRRIVFEGAAVQTQTSAKSRAKLPPRIFAIRASGYPCFERSDAIVSSRRGVFRSGTNV